LTDKERMEKIVSLYEKMDHIELRDHIMIAVFEAASRVGTSPAQLCLGMAIQMPTQTYEEAIEAWASRN
jgi:hypothetical protein